MQQLIADPVQLTRLYESVRPYGGVLCLVLQTPQGQSVSDEQLASVKALVSQSKLPKAELETHSWGLAVKRVGALPGSGSWTHQYGNMANTLKSDDQLVKLPLGVLWYGGVTHEDVLPRHGHGPPEQVVDGRLFIEGIKHADRSRCLHRSRALAA